MPEKPSSVTFCCILQYYFSKKKNKKGTSEQCQQLQSELEQKCPTQNAQSKGALYIIRFKECHKTFVLFNVKGLFCHKITYIMCVHIYYIIDRCVFITRAIKWHCRHAHSPCRAMASLKGCRSVSTDELVSEDVGRLGDTIASLGGALELRGGGALPQRKLIRSSRRIVRLLFFTHARTSLFRL